MAQDRPPDPDTSFLEHLEWVRGLAFALLRDPDEADDLAQEAWLAAPHAPPVSPVALTATSQRFHLNRIDTPFVKLEVGVGGGFLSLYQVVKFHVSPTMTD